MVMDYIKQITGHYLFEDTSTYHIQYNTGVCVDLNNTVFDADKINQLYDFVNKICQ